MKKLVFILLDGLHYQSAKENLGYLEHLVEHKKCAKYTVIGELPSASRPMYETIFTGLPVYKHQITNNTICRLSNKTSIFDLVKAAGCQSFAASYYWISELYVKAPFDYYNDVILDDESKKIQKGFFYYQDTFPDSHLYSIAHQHIIQEHPHFVFIHPMNIDDAGHKYGGESKQYKESVLKNDTYLSSFIPQCMEDGYQVIVGSDHGMSEWGTHGGNGEIQRQTALYIIGDHIENGEFHQPLHTLQMAPLMCYMLGLEPTQDMERLEVIRDEK